MDIEHTYEKLKSVAGRVAVNVPLSSYTTFRIGGPADILAEPASTEELQDIIKLLRQDGVPYVVLGNGSNVLVKDSGFRGVVIVIGKGMDAVEADEDGCTVKAGAGAMLGEVARAAARAALTGLEFASGIPGSIGGGIYMNAGAYGGELSQVVTAVTALMPDGSLREFGAEQLDFGYRHSVFSENGGIIISAAIKLRKGEPDEINEKMKELNRRRVEKQPLNFPSAGSTFKRPEGYFAGKLIQDAGLKGLSVGGALVSPKHAGFIVNTGAASAQDILDLITLVQMRVMDVSGVRLEPEVRIIG